MVNFMENAGQNLNSEGNNTDLRAFHYICILDYYISKGFIRKLGGCPSREGLF